MARQEQPRQKQRQDEQQHKALRRNQILFAIMAVILILSMLLQLVSW